MAKRRTGLGKGLGALISTEATNPFESGVTKYEVTSGSFESETDEAQNKQALIVDIETIYPNPDQPRTRFDEEELDELAQSIKKNGLLQPILVRETNDGYEIIAGERRWQACKKIGLETVPVNITEADDTKSLTLALIENIQRSDLNAMEEAYGYRMLMEREKMTQAQLANAVSKGRSTIANSLRLLELPDDAQKLLLDGKISAGHARAILSIPTDEGRALLVKKLSEGDMSVREAENLAKLYSGRNTEPPKRPATPASFKKVAKGLREAFGTPVRVKTAGGKNKIEIEFKDETELQELFKKMVG